MTFALLRRASLDIVQLSLMWISLIFGVTTVGTVVYEVWFLHRAIATTGMIVSMDLREVAGANGVLSVTYLPTFRFEAAGRQYEVHANVVSDPEAYKVGQKVPVRCLASDPEQAHIDSFLQQWGLTIAFAIATAGFTYLWLVMLRRRGWRKFPAYLFGVETSAAG